MTKNAFDDHHSGFIMDGDEGERRMPLHGSYKKLYDHHRPSLIHVGPTFEALSRSKLGYVLMDGDFIAPCLQS